MNIAKQISTFIFMIGLVSNIAHSKSKIDSVINQAQIQILNEMREDTYFNLPSLLGTPYSVQYMLYTQYSKRVDLFPSHWQTVLEDKIIKERRKDGSWRYLRDLNNDYGELGATIINYWGLKSLGHDENSEIMKKTRKFIIDNGGLEKAPIFLKIFLALFNNYPYSKLGVPPIPNFIFSKSFLMPNAFKTSQFGQWVAPHLLPITYLTKYKVKKDLGPKFSLNELYVEKPHGPKNVPNKQKYKKRHKSRIKRKIPKSHLTSKYLIKKMMKTQKAAGSYGGYTLATFLTNMSYEHFLSIYPSYKSKNTIQDMIIKGDQFLTNQHYDKEKNQYIFGGWTCDGRIWDTALLTQALLETDSKNINLSNAVDFVVSFQTPKGGFPFGLDFESYPDHDDAAEVLLLLNLAENKLSRVYKENKKRLENWLLKRQNSNGGWGAFDVNNNGNFILKLFGADFLDSVDLFDESSADVTAHVVEALASSGHNFDNSKAIRKAYKYLKKTQDPRGIWTGRWGINYIYATSAVITALSNAGIEADAPILKKAIIWLKSKQNNDGGFGESSSSYHDKSLAGIGISTVTQTGWALNALSTVGLNDKKSLRIMSKSSFFLIDFMKKNGKWFDTSVVGTGHPGIIYMDYPSYAYAFPLIALSKYRHFLLSQEKEQH